MSSNNGSTEDHPNFSPPSPSSNSSYSTSKHSYTGLLNDSAFQKQPENISSSSNELETENERLAPKSLPRALLKAKGVSHNRCLSMNDLEPNTLEATFGDMSNRYTDSTASPQSSYFSRSSRGKSARSYQESDLYNNYLSGFNIPKNYNEEEEDDEEKDGLSPSSQKLRFGPRSQMIRQDSNKLMPSLPSLDEINSRDSLRSHIPNDSAQGNIFDIGLITSGGLAPGAGVEDRDNRAAQSQRDQYRVTQDDPESMVTLGSATEDNFNEPGGSSGNTPLQELHHRLVKIAEQSKIEERKHDNIRDDKNDTSKQFARNLVREHSMYLKGGRVRGKESNRRHSIQAGMTVPLSTFFDQSFKTNDTVDQEKNDTEVIPEKKRLSRRDSILNVIHKIEASNKSEPKNDEEMVERDVLQDGTITPRHEDYIPAPTQVRQGVLGSLLQLYGQSQSQGSTSTLYSTESYDSEVSTPTCGRTFDSDTISNFSENGLNEENNGGPKSRVKKWMNHKNNASTSSMTELVMNLYQNPTNASEIMLKEKRGKIAKTKHHSRHNRKFGLELMKKAARKKRKEEEEAAITIYIADVLQRQRFILRLCRALMLFGAPTHRLEEYMKMTTRVLGIDGQFLYIPGCMIISFGDSSTHISEMQLVRCVQGVNLHKLHETHLIYKEVIHGKQAVDEASNRIEKILASKNLYPPWLCVLFFGFSSLAVGPFAFGSRWIDMPISFILGSVVGILQIVVAPRSSLYNNVFEVTASIIVSFLGRAFGSIGKDQQYFCFAAISQSALALILPGYIILCGSLELQSRSIVAGSVRMFYATIYSLFLGFGITLGAVMYGWIDSDATSATACQHPLNDWWHVLFVPMFTIGLALVNQSHWRQIPVMVIISAAGYVATYFSTKRLANASELTSAVGAFLIGVLGNMYSRVGHGLAFAAMLPAIFVQVPSGVAAQGSLIEGINNANHIVSNSTMEPSSYRNVAALGITMVQVSIGITVGLFVATLAIYPFGKKQSGLFTF